MIAAPRQALILAGGLGTRLRPLTNELPKPMIAFHGKPFLEYVIEMLRNSGIERILLLVGYRGEQIVDYFGDGSRFGIQIEYSHGPADDETGTRLRRAASRIDPYFLLLYCDNYWPLDLGALTAAYNAGDCAAMTTVYANDDGWTRDNVHVDETGRIDVYDRSRQASGLAGVDIGFGLFAKRVLDLLPARDNVSFEATVYPQLVATRELAAFKTAHRYYSIGSHERLHATGEFLRRRKTILLDRDGTLNVRMPPGRYVTTPAKFIWKPGALEALRLLARADYRSAIVTNQPGIASGDLATEDLDDIHARLLSDVEIAGGRIDAIYVCAHGWNDGCACRKPRPGLIFAAQRELHLDLSRTTFVGDDERDGQAARAAGSPFVRVGAGHATILDAITAIINGERQFVSAF